MVAAYSWPAASQKSTAANVDARERSRALAVVDPGPRCFSMIWVASRCRAVIDRAELALLLIRSVIGLASCKSGAATGLSVVAAPSGVARPDRAGL